jgi:putative ABC transport system permease protein
MRRVTPNSKLDRVKGARFGPVEAPNDAHRDSRGMAWFDGLLYDLRFTLRGLRRDRTFTLAAIAMLALAIGLNVTVFTVMDTILFRGYPLVTRNDRLVYLQEHGPSGACCISYLDFQDWRAQAHAFEGLAIVSGSAITFRDGDGRPVDMRATTVSANTFGLLGVPPILGRDFAPADEVPGASPVAMLNYRFWDSRFAKRADVVGLTVHINGMAATIIGVMPERFDFPTKVDEDFWMPVVHSPELQQRGLTPGGFTAVGRLRDGASLQEARAELETINRRLEADYPATNRGVIPTFATHSEMNSGPDAPIIWGSLWTAAWFVWLIACANVANLMLVRTMGRWRELSTRIALGAGQRRMMRQMFTESLALTSVAGAIGWWITRWSVRTWVALTASRYQVLDYTVDSGTFAFLVGLSVAAALLCSLAPIGRVVQLGVNGALKGDARGVTQGLRAKHMAAGLVAGQMALAIVLLSGTGVLVRSFMTIVGADTGVRDPERILVGSMRLPSDKYPTPAARLGYFDQVEQRLKTVPGTEAEAVATTLPVKSQGLRTVEIEIDGRPRPGEAHESVESLRAGPEYFRVVGASTISGREFTDNDRATGLPVAIVNQSFAARYWPGEQALGKRLRQLTRNAAGEWRTVVGVVPNIMQGDALRQRFKPLVYVPFQQEPAPSRAFFLLRTSVPPGQIAAAVRAAVQTVDPDVTLEEFDTMKASFKFDRDFMDAAHSELGKHAKVAPIFAAVALLLSGTGLYAMIAYSVSQRTKEIGVRMAIGAASQHIRVLIFREGLRPVMLGLLVGLTVSLAVNRILQSQLVGVSPYDPLTLATAPAVLISVALIACQIPSRRALRIDPAVALRHD